MTLYNNGRIIDVPHDGNCGFHVLLLGLKDLGKIDSLYSNNIHHVRHQIYNYGLRNFHNLRQKLKFCFFRVILKQWHFLNGKQKFYQGYTILHKILQIKQLKITGGNALIPQH